jgi:glycosyltransferase involved in cell wall biosynthesis
MDAPFTGPSHGVSTGPPPRYVLIQPVRDEGDYLPRTLACLVAQTIRPAKLVIVDDGSTDATGAIAEAAAAEHPWIEVIHRRDRGERSVGPGVVDAFYAGYETLGDFAYDFVGKIDGDISFGERYFEIILDRFRRNPRLGAASGKVFMPVGDRLVPERMIDEQVSGTMQFFRRPCFEAVGGFVRGVLWDVIDGHRARMLGWEAWSFPDPEIRILHHRLMGSSHRSIVHGRLRWGRGNYFMGTHPLYAIASGVYRMAERPFIIGGLCIMLGYLLAFLGRAPRYEDSAFRRHLRAWQLRRLGLGGRRSKA